MNGLEQYSKEEIENLAIKYLENHEREKEELSLKIDKIDKEYKKHNTKSVRTAIINGTTILTVSALLMNSKTNIADLGNSQVLAMIDQLQSFGEEVLSLISVGDFPVVLYTKLMGGLDYAIEQLGIVGIALASKSVSLILNSIGNTVKSRKIKKEINSLNELFNTKFNESERQK